jgi:hypothetical protein
MASLDQIWRDYHSGLLSFIRRRVDAADLAEDILQARLESPGGAPAESLRIEFKTGPDNSNEGKAHDHPHKQE